MTMNLRSLRIRLCLLYVVFMLVSLVGLGSFSYRYIGDALASSRLQTMNKREERILTSINNWPAKDTSLTLAEKLRLLSVSVAETDAIQVYDLNGGLIYSSPGPELYKVGWPDKPCIAPCEDLTRKNGHAIRTLNQVVLLGGQRVRLSLSGVIDEHLEILAMVRNSYLLSCPILLVVSIAGGLVLSHGALRPVHRITIKARTIGIHDLHDRLPVPHTADELQEMAEAWNELLGRLDAAINRLTQFTADISHEVRTTITVMWSTAELALKKQRSEEQYHTALRTIVHECAATAQQLDDLLALARAEAVKEDFGWKLVSLSEITAQACAHQSSRVEMRRQSLESRIDGQVCTMGDARMLSRAITTLLDNAIKYTPEEGRIFVSVSGRDGQAKIEVTDTGIGIPAEALSRIFDRFYRVDDSRSRDDGSWGLGLAIAKSIADLHGAAIEVASAPGRGSTFAITMQMHSTIAT